MKSVTDRIPSKVLDAKKLYYANQKLARAYQLVNRIYESNLPPHKKRAHEAKAADAYVKFFNAEAAFRKVYTKLKQGDKRLLGDLIKEEQGEAYTV